MCYELRDLRVAVRDYLKSLGISPLLSDDSAFPRKSGEKPYVTCLRTLEECPLVVGVIEDGYGKPFDDWGAYPQYSGLSPTHAEFRHALHMGKKLLLYIHRSTMAAYNEWLSDPVGFAALTRSHGAEIKTLEMID